MKAIFTHDHIFRQDTKGNYYTAGSFNNEVWKRYLRYFNELSVIARLENNKIGAENTFNNFNLNGTHFRPVQSLSGPIAQFKNKQVVSKIIKEELAAADVLIARLPSEIGNLAIDIAKEFDKPYVVEVVACAWDALWNYGSLQAKLYAPVATIRMKKRVKKAPNVIYVTNQFLQDRYPCKGDTENISNVEIANVSKEALANRLDRYKINQTLFTIGTIGSLKNKIKGLETALRALAILNKENINFEFQVLGDGDQEPWRLMARGLGIEDKVKFKGVLPGGAPVLEWLDNIDIYIQPSYQEGLPRAVIEAMSRGCPVIGSTAGGIPELIYNGCIHDPGDHNTLSTHLKVLLSDVSEASKLARENIEESRKYTKDILDRKRDIFWSKFI